LISQSQNVIVDIVMVQKLVCEEWVECINGKEN
jgi:hypothetical protein